MHGICVYLFCASLLISAVYGSKGSDAAHSCSIKCDVVQEVTLLRQLLNQESLLRINTNNEIMDLKKAVKRARSSITAIQNENRALKKDLTSLTNSVTTVKNDNRATRQDLTSLTNSVTTVKNDNRAARQDMTSLERTMTSMNQTLQGKYSLPYNISEN